MRALPNPITLAAALAVAATLGACGGGGDAPDATAQSATPTQHALSGGGGSGGGGGGGGGTVLLQVADTWNGVAHYDPALSTLRAGVPLDRTIRLVLTEDAAGAVSGTLVLETYTPWVGAPPVTLVVALVGKASSSSMSANIPVSFYGGKEAYKLTDAGPTICPDGSTGRALAGTFNSKDINGSGTGPVTVNNCPAI